MNFRIPNLITSFKKYLRSNYGQSVLEYSLILIVVAALTLGIFLRVGPFGIGNDLFNIFRVPVTTLNMEVGGCL